VVLASLLALIGFSFVSSVTPGPNNVLLWASGSTFGLRRTGRHILGTAIGIAIMALAAAAGLAALVTAVPQLAIAMRVAGSVYLIWLAIQIARGGTLAGTVVARPLGLFEAAGFQVINPKAWIFALGAMTTFRPVELPIVAGSVVVAATMFVVILPTATIWALGGDALSRLANGPRAGRALSLILAGLVAATVVSVWL
jgi:threonine/homoserine/homoserine lactone efflux protein